MDPELLRSQYQTEFFQSLQTGMPPPAPPPGIDPNELLQIQQEARAMVPAQFPAQQQQQLQMGEAQRGMAPMAGPVPADPLLQQPEEPPPQPPQQMGLDALQPQMPELQPLQQPERPEVAQAMQSGRVLGNAPVAPQRGLVPVGAPIPYGGGHVRQYGYAQPPQQQQQQQDPPGMEFEPWKPGGGWGATPAQIQLANTIQKGGTLGKDIYHNALLDKQAQMGGQPGAIYLSRGEMDIIQEQAERGVPRNARNRPDKVSAREELLTNIVLQSKREGHQRQQITRENMRKEAEDRNQAQVQQDKQFALQNRAQDFTEKRDLRKEQREIDRDLKKEAAEKEKKAKPPLTPIQVLGRMDHHTKFVEDEYKKQKEQFGEDKLPEGLKTPEARKQFAEDLFDQEMTQIHSEAMPPEQKEALKKFQESLPKAKEGGLDLMKASPEQLQTLSKMLENPYQFGVSRKVAKKLKEKIDTLLSKAGSEQYLRNQ